MDLCRPNQKKHRGYTGARLELIKKAASMTLEGATILEIARELTVSESTVRRLLKASEGLPTSYLSETARVARLLELKRIDGLIREFFPTATGRNVAGGEPSFNDSLEAAKIILDTIDLRTKLLRYEDVSVITPDELARGLTLASPSTFRLRRLCPEEVI
jgi:hypothetical protein